MNLDYARNRTEKIRRLLEHEWRSDRVEATAHEVLSIADKLLNLKSLVRAGRNFVLQLLRLTGLHGKD